MTRIFPCIFPSLYRFWRNFPRILSRRVLRKSVVFIGYKLFLRKASPFFRPAK